MIDKDFELAGDLFNELDTQIFGETVQLCKECDIFVQVSMMQGGGNTKGNFNTIYQTFKF